MPIAWPDRRIGRRQSGRANKQTAAIQGISTIHQEKELGWVSDILQRRPGISMAVVKWVATTGISAKGTVEARATISGHVGRHRVAVDWRDNDLLLSHRGCSEWADPHVA